MNYLIRLKHIFAFKKVKKQFHYLLLYVITLIYIVVKNNYFLLVLIALYLIIFFIYNKTLLYYALILSLIIVPYIIINNYSFNKNDVLYIEGYGKTYKVVNYDDYDKVYVKINNKKYIFNTTDQNYSSGDILYIKGKVKQVSKAHYKNGFNYYNYLTFLKNSSAIR